MPTDNPASLAPPVADVLADVLRQVISAKTKELAAPDAQYERPLPRSVELSRWPDSTIQIEG